MARKEDRPSKCDPDRWLSTMEEALEKLERGETSGIVAREASVSPVAPFVYAPSAPERNALRDRRSPGKAGKTRRLTMRAGSRRSKSAGARMRSSARQIGTRKRAGRSAWPSKQRCSRLLQRRSGECLRSVAALPAGTRRRRPASPRPQRRRQLRRRGRRRRCRNALPRRGAKRKPRRGCKKLLRDFLRSLSICPLPQKLAQHARYFVQFCLLLVQLLLQEGQRVLLIRSHRPRLR